MSVGKSHALRCESVDVGRWNFAALRVVALHIAVSEIVGVQDEDIGFLRRSGARREAQEKEDSEDGDDPGRHVVAANASVALWTAGIAGDWKESLPRINSILDSGKALETLERWALASNG